MPYDITLCPGISCPIKANCLRNTGMVYGRQDFFGHTPFDFKRGTCDHYMDDRPKDGETREYAYKLWEKDGYKEGKDLEYWFEAQRQLTERNRNS